MLPENQTALTEEQTGLFPDINKLISLIWDEVNIHDFEAFLHDAGIWRTPLSEQVEWALDPEKRYQRIRRKKIAAFRLGLILGGHVKLNDHRLGFIHAVDIKEATKRIREHIDEASQKLYENRLEQALSMLTMKRIEQPLINIDKLDDSQEQFDYMIWMITSGLKIIDKYNKTKLAQLPILIPNQVKSPPKSYDHIAGKKFLKRVVKKIFAEMEGFLWREKN